jgi:hypothetical protein
LERLNQGKLFFFLPLLKLRWYFSHDIIPFIDNESGKISLGIARSSFLLFLLLFL